MKPCNHPACPCLVPLRTRYCEHHVMDARKAMDQSYDRFRRSDDPALRQAEAFRSSPRWQRLRKLKLSINPLCEDPYLDHTRQRSTVTAKQVHHIVSIQDNPDKAFLLANLMSVCTKCHARLSVNERRNVS